MSLAAKVTTLIVSFWVLAALSYVSITTASNGGDTLNCFLVVVTTQMIWGVLFASSVKSTTK